MGTRQLQQRVQRLERKLATRLAVERDTKELEVKQRQSERHKTILHGLSKSELILVHEAMRLEREGKPLRTDLEAALERLAVLLQQESLEDGASGEEIAP